MSAAAAGGLGCGGRTHSTPSCVAVATPPWLKDSTQRANSGRAIRTRRVEGRKTLISPSAIRVSKNRLVHPICCAASLSEIKARSLASNVFVSTSFFTKGDGAAKYALVAIS